MNKCVSEVEALCIFTIPINNSGIIRKAKQTVNIET